MDFVQPNTTNQYTKKNHLKFHFGLIVSNLGLTRCDIDDDGNLLNGVWLDEQQATNALNQILGHVKKSSKPTETNKIIPHNVLYENDNLLVWYTPTQKVCNQWYTHPRGTMLKEVPHPRLVFAASKRSRFLSICAIQNDDKRPTESTPIYYCPVANMYKEGHLCIGTAQMPKIVNYTTIPDLENVVFLSQYSGFKFEAMKEGDSMQNWTNLQGEEEFPDSLLCEPAYAKTLGHFLSLMIDKTA